MNRYITLRCDPLDSCCSIDLPFLAWRGVTLLLSRHVPRCRDHDTAGSWRAKLLARYGPSRSPGWEPTCGNIKATGINNKSAAIRVAWPGLPADKTDTAVCGRSTNNKQQQQQQQQTSSECSAKFAVRNGMYKLGLGYGSYGLRRQRLKKMNVFF